MMKDNTESLSERLLFLENRMKALEKAGIGGAELKKVQDATAELILENKEKFLKYLNKSEEDTEKYEDLISELIILFYDRYKASIGPLYPFLQCRLRYIYLNSLQKKKKEVLAKEQERDQPDYLMADNRPDEKMNQERDVIADFEADEAFLNLSALVTRFFEERDRRSGTQKGFRYYKAVYTQGIFDYLKDGLENPPEFQHEVDIIRAADEAFANFVTLHHPYSDKEPLEIRKIFFNDLEYNRAVAPSYVKNVYPDEVIAIPMKPFVIGGYMERVHHMKVSASLVSQQMSRYERDAAEVLHKIGIESKRYKEKTEERDD